MSKREFCKTIVTVEVLSEQPIEFDDLQELHNMIEHGNCSGQFTADSAVILNGEPMAQALIAQFSDPEFFQLTETGEDID